jgi:phenolic acid decarboxylase
MIVKTIYDISSNTNHIKIKIQTTVLKINWDDEQRKPYELYAKNSKRIPNKIQPQMSKPFWSKSQRTAMKLTETMEKKEVTLWMSCGSQKSRNVGWNQVYLHVVTET